MDKYIFRYLKYLLFASSLGIGMLAGLFYYYSQELPPLSELQNYDMKTGSEVYDINDKLIHSFAVEKRRLTNINELPPHITLALLAVEDYSFYDHWGVNLISFTRSIIINAIRGNFSQGASTITQQLARNMFLTLDKTLPRKIKEWILSAQIERVYSKSEILEMYLNKVPFGPGIYGIEAAALRYFNKEAKDLSIDEAAMIVGLTQLPGAYYPYTYPERALKRRRLVLSRMYNENLISKKEYKQLAELPLKLNPFGSDGNAASYFIEQIRRMLEPEFGTNRLFTGGLKIYTTIDIDLQNYADSVLNNVLTEFEERNKYKYKYSDFPPDTIDITTPYIQGGIFAIEPETGYVRIMIGGRNFKHSKFNRITQAVRQPGSAFKPILYSAAIDKGYTPATVIKDEPTVFYAENSILWKVHNYSRDYFGYIRLRDAIKDSRNVCAAKVIYDITPDLVVEYAQRFGLTTSFKPVYSLSIGTCDVKPIELISGYTAFPNNGIRTTPVFIRRVEDQGGNIIKTWETDRIEVLDEKTAYLMTNMLQTVIDEGTGEGVRMHGYSWPAAGKTGTTDDFRDAWFIGFNRQLVTGIWVGFDNNKSLGRRQTGATVALPPWPYIMSHAVMNTVVNTTTGKRKLSWKDLDFIKPEGIISKVVSKETGLLPKSTHEATIAEYFIKNTEPTILSDSLKYNFLPSLYRENSKDSLIIDIDGSFDYNPKGARLIKERKYVN